MRLGNTNVENDSCGGMSSDHWVPGGITNLDREPVELAEAVE
jgi:hypothetical protein